MNSITTLDTNLSIVIDKLCELNIESVYEWKKDDKNNYLSPKRKRKIHFDESFSPKKKRKQI